MWPSLLPKKQLEPSASTWSPSKEERRICEEWKLNPLRNPESGMKIERNGPTYKTFQERCKQVGIPHLPRATKTITKEKMQDFLKNPKVNPETGRKIKKRGPTYTRVKKQCIALKKEYVHGKVTLLGDYFPPDEKGMVPVKVVGKKKYITRQQIVRNEGKESTRTVYGRLNKYAGNGVSALEFYKHTWDYKKGYYKPFFIGKEPVDVPITSPPPLTLTKEVIKDCINKVILPPPKEPSVLDKLLEDGMVQRTKESQHKIIDLFLPKVSYPDYVPPRK